MHRFVTTFVLSIALLCSLVCADEEIGNQPYVHSIGHYYAKSVPGEPSGSKGSTRIFRVREQDDELVCTFNWYAPQIALTSAGKGLAVIRIGSWPRGHEANKDELA